MFQPTMTITGLGSGYTGPGVKTLVPSTAVARLDMRLVPDQDPDTVFRLLQEHVIEHDASVEVTRLSSVPPSRTPATNQYVGLLADACAHATGMRPFVVPSLGSTLPNHVFTDILGMPSVLLPYANPDQCNHAPNENFELARYKDGMRTCAAVLFHLATGATASR
jgi:acetylornithine deacetylase/succinyl-diaminopimelate desuccinylase-like protein